MTMTKIDVVTGLVTITDDAAPSFAPTLTAEELLAQARNATSMSRAAFAIGAANAGWITENEAEDWAAGVSIPTIAANAISTLPEADRFVMRISVRTRQKIWRTDTLVLILMAAQDPQVTAEQMDTFFGIGV